MSSCGIPGHNWTPIPLGGVTVDIPGQNGPPVPVGGPSVGIPGQNSPPVHLPCLPWEFQDRSQVPYTCLPCRCQEGTLYPLLVSPWGWLARMVPGEFPCCSLVSPMMSPGECPCCLPVGVMDQKFSLCRVSVWAVLRAKKTGQVEISGCQKQRSLTFCLKKTIAMFTNYIYLSHLWSGERSKYHAIKAWPVNWVTSVCYKEISEVLKTTCLFCLLRYVFQLSAGISVCSLCNSDRCLSVSVYHTSLESVWC